MKLGFGERSNDQFATFSAGKVVIKCEEKDPRAIKKTKESGEVYYVREYTEFAGYLVGVEFRESRIDTSKTECVLNMDIGTGSNVKIQFNVGSGYWYNFSKMIGNADLSQPIRLIPKYEEKDGKKSSSLFLAQEPGYLKSLYTKDSPNGIPEGKKVTIGKKEVWDFSEQEEWLIEKIKGLSFSSGAPKAAVVEFTETQDTDDELPF